MHCKIYYKKCSKLEKAEIDGIRKARKLRENENNVALITYLMKNIYNMHSHMVQVQKIFCIPIYGKVCTNTHYSACHK